MVDVLAPGVEKQACELETSVSVVPSLRMHETVSSRPSSTPLPVLYVIVTNGNVVDIMQLVSSYLCDHLINFIIRMILKREMCSSI